MSKPSIIRLEDHNFTVLYDNKPLFVGIKDFCALLKKVKDFTRNRYIKVKNPLVLTKLRDVFLRNSFRDLL